MMSTPGIGVAALICAATLLLTATSHATAQETVNVGGVDAVLLKPKTPRASVILMPGADGMIGAAPGGVITRLKGNQLVRTRNSYLARGLAVLVIGAGEIGRASCRERGEVWGDCGACKRGIGKRCDGSHRV